MIRCDFTVFVIRKVITMLHGFGAKINMVLINFVKSVENPILKLCVVNGQTSEKLYYKNLLKFKLAFKYRHQKTYSNINWKLPLIHC